VWVIIHTHTQFKVWAINKHMLQFKVWVIHRHMLQCEVWVIHTHAYTYSTRCGVYTHTHVHPQLKRELTNENPDEGLV
jgi:hypothetical protein